MIAQYNEIPELKSNNLLKTYINDAGYDIRIPRDTYIDFRQSVVVSTGLHVCLPLGYFALIKSRSGLAIKHQIEVTNAGVIDNGYHGEIIIRLYNHHNETGYQFLAGERFAQLIPQLDSTAVRLRAFPQIIQEIPMKDWPSSERARNGIGSSGR
jgi:dUTP pyrophosphatase